MEAYTIFNIMDYGIITE